MAFCSNCGAVLEKEARFCSKCGHAAEQPTKQMESKEIEHTRPFVQQKQPVQLQKTNPVTAGGPPIQEHESSNFNIPEKIIAAFVQPGPQSLGNIVVDKIRQIWQYLKKDWKRTLLFKILGFILFIGLFTIWTMIFQGIIADTYHVSRWVNKGGIFNFFGNLLPYITITKDSGLEIFKGLQFFSVLDKIFHLPREIKTSFLATPLYIVLPMFLISMFMYIRTGKRFFKDIAGLPKTIFKYMTMEQNGAQCFGIALALVFSFLILNPVTIVVLAIWTLISVSNRYGSKLMIFFMASKMDLNRIKKRELSQRAESAIGATGGFAVGMIISVVVTLFTWFIFEYHMWSRVVFLLLPGVLLFIWFLNKSKFTPMKVKAAKAALILAFVCMLLAPLNMSTFADDGGWSESGRNISDWLKNPGTKLMELFGLEGSIATAFGALLGLVASGMANIVPGILGTIGTVSGLLGVLADIFSANPGHDACMAGIGALGVAIPILGDIMGGAAKQINNSLAGSEGGSPSVPSKDSGGAMGTSGSSPNYGGSSGSGGKSGSSSDSGSGGKSGSGSDSGSGGKSGSGSDLDSSGNSGTGSSSSSSGNSGTSSGSDSGGNSGTGSGSGSGGNSGTGSSSGSSGNSGTGSGSGSGSNSNSAGGSIGVCIDPRVSKINDILSNLNKEIKRQIESGNISSSDFKVLNEKQLFQTAQDIVNGYDNWQSSFFRQGYSFMTQSR